MTTTSSPLRIPSREDILAQLRDHGPASDIDLAATLKVSKKALPALERRLVAMAEDLLIKIQKNGMWQACKTTPFLRAQVFLHPDGFGFLSNIPNQEDMFMPAAELTKVMHGDWVLALPQPSTGRGGRARIVEIIARAHKTIVGTLQADGEGWRLQAFDKRLQQRIHVKKILRSIKPQVGASVVANITAFPERFYPIEVEVVEALQESGSKLEIEIALRRFDLPHEFSKKALELSQRRARHSLKNEIKERIDLRELPFVTIDGESARDFDDAVYCTPLKIGGKVGYRLYVAIADVSHYVSDGDVLDEEARSRATSIYFPQQVIPMLPESLSNDACSLVPATDRLVLVCETDIDNNGKVERYEFYEAVIHSAARLTYTRVAEMLEAGKPHDVSILVHANLQTLHNLTTRLLGARGKRFALELEMPEAVFEFDKDNEVIAIHRVMRNFAHRMIEEAMLVANVCAANFLHDTPSLFRIHPPPEDKKITQLIHQLEEFGVPVKELKQANAKKTDTLAQALVATATRALNHPLSEVIQTLILRSLQQARYDAINLGHFGLSYAAYTHFTSPIRRYPDLLIHRAIKAKVARQKYLPWFAADGKINGQPVSKNQIWSALGQHCSQRERLADEASRDINQYWKCRFMTRHTGKTFQVQVIGCAQFGVFARFGQWDVQGLIPATLLQQLQYRFEPQKRLWRGPPNQPSLSLGNMVTVEVEAVAIESRQIQLHLKG